MKKIEEALATVIVYVMYLIFKVLYRLTGRRK